VSPEPDEVLELLRASVSLLEQTPARLELAYSLVAPGSALRRHRHRKAAPEILERGLDIAALDDPG